MRKLLNTLYIFQEEVYLKLDGLNVVVTAKGKETCRFPFCNLESIVGFNYMGCTPQLMAKCAEESVGLYFLKPSGEFLARITGKIKGNVHLRVKQFEQLKNTETCLNLAIKTVNAKISNTKSFLDKQMREYLNLMPFLSKTVENLTKYTENLNSVTDIDSLRGIEGSAAKEYFDCFKFLIRNENFAFKNRTKRPPLDPVNAVLSYLYTLLALDCESALETVGLDPFIGYFHTDRSGRASLAMDLMEEFRCFLVDRCVLSLFNNRQLKPEHFTTNSSGAVFMTDEGKKIIINIWQTRKKEELRHKTINEKVPFGLLPFVQANLLAKFLRGECKEYYPFEVAL